MHSKKILFIAFLLNFCFAGQAQFFALAYDSVSPYVTVLPYPDDGNFRVVSFSHRFATGAQNRTSIKVYNAGRQYVKTINLIRGITLVNDYPPLRHGNHLLWPANFADTIIEGRNSLAILELDTGFNYVDLHKLSTHTAQAQPSGIVGYSGGFIVGEYFSGVPPTRTGISTRLYKLDLNFIKKDSAWFEDELRLRTQQLVYNLIVGASDDITSSCSSTTQTTQKIVLDLNLAIVDCHNLLATSIYFCYDGGGNMVLRFADVYKRKGIVFPLINSNNYIHAEVDYYNCTNSNVKYSVVKNAIYAGNTGLKAHVNDHYPSNTNYLLYFSSNADYNAYNTINVTTVGLPEKYTVDRNFYKPYYAKDKTKILVTKLDISGNLVWKREYGGDMNYFPRSVAFTPDGGCVVAGSRYNDATMQATQLFENFLLKLDAAGDITGLNETDFIPGPVCYPNPASQEVYFDLPYASGNCIRIFNCLGQLVAANLNYGSGEPVAINNLTPGIYTYTVQAGARQWRGKLVVE